MILRIVIPTLLVHITWTVSYNVGYWDTHLLPFELQNTLITNQTTIVMC